VTAVSAPIDSPLCVRPASFAAPRIVAFAEKLWSPARRANFDDFRRRLAVHEKRLELMGVDFRR